DRCGLEARGDLQHANIRPSLKCANGALQIIFSITEVAPQGNVSDRAHGPIQTKESAKIGIGFKFRGAITILAMSDWSRHLPCPSAAPVCSMAVKSGKTLARNSFEIVKNLLDAGILPAIL